MSSTPTHDRTQSRVRPAGFRSSAAGLAVVCLTLIAASSCTSSPSTPQPPTFATPEEAVQQLRVAARDTHPNAVLAVFGPDARDLVDTSDPTLSRRRREVFTAAMAEGWRLVDDSGDRRTLVVGNESWPFPVPLVRGAGGWHFDTAAGKEEILARQIGRNELVSIRVCRTYVAAQRLYAESGHDGKAAGLFAKTVASDPGRQNGLYWPPVHGQRRSPLGDLLAQAASDRPGATSAQPPAPFHGYYFRILTGQGSAARGGAQDYLVNGDLSRGFALVAWPARYDVTGVMTFIVNQDGVVAERDLGPAQDGAGTPVAIYDPDAAWHPVP